MPGLNAKRKMMGRRHIVGIFWRYTFQYSFIVLIIFAVISLYMSSFYNRAYRDRFIEVTRSDLGHIRMLNENNLVQLYNISNQVAFSVDITSFRLSEDVSKGYRVKRWLSAFNINAGFFSKVFLLYDDDDYLYNAATSIRMDMFLREGFLCEHVSPEKLAGLLRGRADFTVIPAQVISGIAVFGAPGEYVTYITHFSNESGTNSGTLVFLVGTDAYYSFFNRGAGEQRDICVFDENGVPIVWQSNLGVPFDTVKPFMKTEGTVAFEYENQDYTLVTLKGELNGMIYASLFPTDSLLRGSHRAQFPFWLLMFVLSVSALILITIVSHRNYIPLRRIWNLLRSDVTESADGDSEGGLWLIEAGIASLKTTNVELTARLDYSLHSRRGDFVHSFIKGRYADRAACVKAAADLGVDIEGRAFFAVMMAGFPESMAFTDATALLVGSLSTGAVTGCAMEAVAPERMIFVLFAEDASAIFRWIEQAHQAWRNSRATVSAGGAHCELSHNAIAYFEANLAFDYRFIRSNDKVIYFSDVTPPSPGKVYPKVAISALSGAIDSGDRGSVETALDDLLGYCRGLDVSLFTFRCIYSDILGVLLRRLSADGRDDAFSRMDDVFTLSGCLSIDDLDNLLRSTCLSLISRNGPRQQEHASLIRDICEYIQKNYADANLSMAAVAEHFCLGTVKFSLEFRESVGVSPSEYLMLLRVGHAKTLLIDTDIPVKDICAMVGYIDVSGFIRRFKTQTAMTPNRYRQLMREKH